jgi:AI-2 transport protein TqsA
MVTPRTLRAVSASPRIPGAMMLESVVSATIASNEPSNQRCRGTGTTAELSQPRGPNLQRTTPALLSIAALVIIIAGLQAATWLLLPAVLAIFIAAMVVPLLHRLRGWGLPTWAAITIVMVVVLAGLAGFITLITRSFQDLIGTFATHRAVFEEFIAFIDRGLREAGLPISLSDLIAALDPAALLTNARSFASGVASLVSNALFVTVMVGFMVAETAGLARKLDVAWGPLARRGQGIRDAVKRVRRYVWLKTLISLATGLFAGLATWAAGVEAPLLWGVLAFGLNYIPMLGSLIAAIPPVLLAFAQGWPTALALAAAYLVINIVMANIIEPRVLGERLNISPAVILLSLLFWGWIFGPIGLLLAVPFTMIVSSYAEYHKDLRWLAILLASNSKFDDRSWTFASPTDLIHGPIGTGTAS